MDEAAVEEFAAVYCRTVAHSSYENAKNYLRGLRMNLESTEPTFPALAAAMSSAAASLSAPEDISSDAKSSRSSRRRIRVGSTKCTTVTKDERERRNAKRKAALQARKRNRK